MAQNYLLEFEKPLRDLEEKIESAKLTALERGIDMSKEIKSQEAKLAEASQKFYANLTRWQRVQMARHPQRPYALDYIKAMSSEWLELHGDRHFGDDKAVVGGLATVGKHRVVLMGQQKGRGTRDNMYRNFGMPNPEGYRKALRLMQLAEKHGRPVVSLIDTPGAYPGLGAEERGQAEAIAKNLMVMSTLKVPIVVVVIGEGASGGAVGMGIGDRLLMLENTWFSVISPEGCASILYRDSSRASEAADAMRVTPADLVEMGIADEVLPEPLGGAHRNPDMTAKTLKQAIVSHLDELVALEPGKLVDDRVSRYERIGQWQE